MHGVQFTIAIVHDLVARAVYEQAGIDVSINPRQVTAEEIARFAHDPRTQQVAMLEGDRFEVLDLTTRSDSEYVGMRFRDMPIRGALIGAIVRDGKAVFPRSDDMLQAGDRVIVFTETSRVPARRESVCEPTAAIRRAGDRAGSAVDAPRPRWRSSGRSSSTSASRALFPAALALGYRRAALAVRLRRRDRLRRRARARADLRGERDRVGFREGYLVVALTWLLAAAFGALPYLLSGGPQLDRPVDALFETMSGFTTTGATVLTDVEAVDRSLLMWRQFTQWLGGMGIIVLALAVLPRLRVGGRQLSRASCPGPRSTSSRSGSARPRSGSGSSTSRSRVVQIAILTAFGWSGSTSGWTLFEARVALPSRRCRPAASAPTAARSRSSPRHPVGDDRCSW